MIAGEDLKKERFNFTRIMNILITGAAGFIGFHTANLLLRSKFCVYGIDSLNNYYDVSIKKQRLKILNKNFGKKFKFYKNDMMSEKYLLNIINKNNIKIIIHLKAAQAGVRHSLKKPMDYVKNNIVSTTNLMEATRKSKKIKHFLLASTAVSMHQAKKHHLMKMILQIFLYSFMQQQKIYRINGTFF